jgi:hypothetical protein
MLVKDTIKILLDEFSLTWGKFICVLQLKISYFSYAFTSVVHLYIILETKHLLQAFPIPSRARICKRLRSPGIDSKKSIPPTYVAWRAGTTTLFVLPGPPGYIGWGNRSWTLNRLQIQALHFITFFTLRPLLLSFFYSFIFLSIFLN